MTARDKDLSIEFLESGEADLDDLDRDGVASLHDVEAEAGDEEGVRDSFTLDQREARELGVNLDPIGGSEPRLD